FESRPRRRRPVGGTVDDTTSDATSLRRARRASAGTPRRTRDGADHRRHHQKIPAARPTTATATRAVHTQYKTGPGSPSAASPQAAAGSPGDDANGPIAPTASPTPPERVPPPSSAANQAPPHTMPAEPNTTPPRATRTTSPPAPAPVRFKG